MIEKIEEGEEPLGVIVGGSKCGKTTLARVLVVMMWLRYGLRSIVFDPFYFKHNWGRTAWVTGDLARFKAAVTGTRNCAVFWDESTTTLRKTAMDDVAFFTQIRHLHKACFTIGHDFTCISPTMRGNLSEAYVFRQSGKRALDWVDLFADEEMAKTATLQKREFIHKVAFEPIVRRSLTRAELASLPR